MAYNSTIKALNFVICSNMDGPREYHICKSEKDKYHMISLICGIKKNDTNELTKQKHSQTQKNKRERVGEMDKLTDTHYYI